MTIGDPDEAKRQGRWGLMNSTIQELTNPGPAPEARSDFVRDMIEAESTGRTPHPGPRRNQRWRVVRRARPPINAAPA